MYDLECVEIWERFTCFDQFSHFGAYGFNHVGCHSHFNVCGAVRVWARVWVRVDDGELDESGTRGHVS